MWSDRQARRTEEAAASSPDPTNAAFIRAVEAARAREDRFRPLIDQFGFALRVAESPVPIDRATIPLHLPLGPEKVKEMAGQIKLSPYLKRDLRMVCERFHAAARECRKAEKAAERLTSDYDLLIEPSAVDPIERLFRFIEQSGGVFEDYPLIRGLFSDAAKVDTIGEAEAGLLNELQATVADELAGYFTQKPRETETPAADEVVAEAPEAGRRVFWPALPAWRRPTWLSFGRQPPPAPEPEPESTWDESVDGEDDMGPAGVLKLLGVAPITLEVGLDVVSLVDPLLGGELMDRIAPMRVDIALDTGFITPGVQFKDNLDLPATTYRILVRQKVVAEATLRIGSMLAVQQRETDTSRELFGVITGEPAFGRPAVWVSGDEVSLAESLGYLIQDPTSVVVAHLDETIRRYAHEILSLDEVGIMLNRLRDTRPEAAACVPMKLDLAEYHQILRLLLRERVSIRDQELILETLTQHLTPPREPGNLLYNVLLDTTQQFQGAQVERMRAAVSSLTIDPAQLAEVVRRRLSWHICNNLADEDGMLDVIELKPQIEDLILNNIKPEGRFWRLVLRPDTEDRLVKALLAECAGQERPVVLCDAAARPYVRQLVERVLPSLTVISHAELHPAFHPTTVGTVSLIDA